MTNKGSRRYGQPILINGDNANRLERIPVNSKAFDEDWIQHLINQNPDVLPISEIDTGFTPAISIGREIATKVGYIDNLFISPDGYLTLVETKLWRSPEARREVVGQILDYAKELHKWTYMDLDNTVKKFNRQYNNNTDGLIATVKKHAELEESDEKFFIDNVSKNLRRGRFLLLIVGDGIRESVEDMVEYLTQTPQLYFTLALVELQVYKLNDGQNSLMVIPQLITRTREITRAIVRIEGTYLEDVKVNIETDLGTEAVKNGYKRITVTEEDYFEQLLQNTNPKTLQFAKKIIKDCEALGLIIEWNSGSFSMKLPDPQGSGINIAILNVDRTGHFNLGRSRPQFVTLELDREISYRFSQATCALLPGIEQNPGRKHMWLRPSTLDDLQGVYQPFMEKLQKYLEEIIKASNRKD